MLHEVTVKGAGVRDAVDQDYETYQRLYKDYAPIIYGVIVKVVHDERLALDMLQDVFVDLCSRGVAEAGRLANTAIIIRLTYSILRGADIKIQKLLI